MFLPLLSLLSFIEATSPGFKSLFERCPLLLAAGFRWPAVDWGTDGWDGRRFGGKHTLLILFICFVHGSFVWGRGFIKVCEVREHGGWLCVCVQDTGLRGKGESISYRLESNDSAC